MRLVCFAYATLLFPISILKTKFGIIGEQLWRHANGIDESDIHEKYEPSEKSFLLGKCYLETM